MVKQGPGPGGLWILSKEKSMSGGFGLFGGICMGSIDMICWLLLLKGLRLLCVRHQKRTETVHFVPNSVEGECRESGEKNHFSS